MRVIWLEENVIFLQVNKFPQCVSLQRWCVRCCPEDQATGKSSEGQLLYRKHASPDLPLLGPSSQHTEKKEKDGPVMVCVQRERAGGEERRGRTGLTE